MAEPLYYPEGRGAWRMSMLPDCKNIVNPAAAQRPDLMSCQLQDVGQLTVLCGVWKDEAALGIPLRQAGGKGEGKEKKEGP